MNCLACECSFSLAGYLTRVSADAPAEWVVHLLPGPFTKELPPGGGPCQSLSIWVFSIEQTGSLKTWGGFLTRSPNLVQQTCLPSAKVHMTEMHMGIASPPYSTDNSTFSFYFPLYLAPFLLSYAQCLLPAQSIRAEVSL